MSVRWGGAMRIIGHRGCMDHYPQNTVAAVRGSAPHVDMVEVDVRRCRTGELVVFHDETLDRLTAVSGPVSERSFAELSSLTVGDSEETIPSLGDVLAALPGGTGINVELKHAGMYEEVAALLRQFDDEVIVSSFERDALTQFRDVPTAYLFAESFSANLDIAVELGCAFVHPHYGITEPERIERAHDRGLGVHAWTVRTSAQVRRLRSGGVDGVIVDSWEIVR